MPNRTPDQIRASIEQNRVELNESLGKLRSEVSELTDWRAQLRANQEQLIIGTLAVGFVLSGGVGGLLSIITGRRRRKARKLQRAADKITAQAHKAERKAAKLAAKVKG